MISPLKAFRSCRTAVWVFAAPFLFSLSNQIHARDGEAERNLKLFEDFTRGQIPIREAVVYREIRKPDGTVFNRDWFKFSYQAGGSTYYIQRMAPGTNDSSKLVPVHGNETYGASFTHFWVISDTDIHVAEKGLESGSGPEHYSAFPLNFIEGAICLGIPHVRPSSISWTKSGFLTKVVTEGLSNGKPKGTNTISGSRVLNEKGNTISCSYPTTGELQGEEIVYDYDHSTNGLPGSFQETVLHPGGEIYSWRFLSLDVGEVNLKETGGYVPAMFGAPNTKRNPTLWTNQHPYTVLGSGTAPAFKTREPEKVALGIFTTSVIAVIAISAFWFRRWKKNGGQTD